MTRSQNVLITGSAGFLGRHFRARLEAGGHDIVGYDTAARFRCDIRKELLYYDGRQRFDLLIHCAAVVNGRGAIENAQHTQFSNFALDATAFEWAVRTRTPMIYLSSSAVYPIRRQRQLYVGDTPISMKPALPASLVESDVDLDEPDLPDELYGWSKLTGERLARLARDKTRILVVRPFSGYGTDQDRNYPFPAFIRRALARLDPFEIWGTGEQVRDFIHVDDVVEATLTLFEAGVEGPVNIGSGIGTSMRDLAVAICGRAGFLPEFKTLEDAPAGVQYRVADTRLLEAHYTPKVSLEEGIDRALRGEL